MCRFGFLLISFCAAAFGGPVLADNTDSARVVILGRVRAPLEIVQNKGFIILPSIVAPYGASSFEVPLNCRPPRRHCAVFDVKGERGFAFAIAVSDAQTSHPDVAVDPECRTRFGGETGVLRPNARLRCGGTLSIDGDFRGIFAARYLVSVTYD